MEFLGRFLKRFLERNDSRVTVAGHFSGKNEGNAPYYRANLGPVQMETVENYFREHQDDPQIFSMIDAVKALFPDELKKISPAQYEKIIKARN